MNLNFQFDSVSDFFTMSGHGPYVWVCYLVTYFAIGYLMVAPIVANRRLLARLKRQQRLEQAEQHYPLQSENHS
ncbi:heme exporter protein CcmD [Halioxenophilus sp. WMMB6]|uniref:heme exporter protein CcmD n=1 Tax=Halioxenophilus sp. WMMB6 TaxID=3073815 RepID=UPI00398BFC39